MVVSSIFYFRPYLGKWSNLTNIFQMGWNHQQVKVPSICSFWFDVWINGSWADPVGPCFEKTVRFFREVDWMISFSGLWWLDFHNHHFTIAYIMRLFSWSVWTYKLQVTYSLSVIHQQLPNAWLVNIKLWDFPMGFPRKKTEDGLDVTGMNLLGQLWKWKEMDWR